MDVGYCIVFNVMDLESYFSHYLVTPREVPYLIFAKRVAIHRINLNGTELDTVISNTSNAIAIDFDARYLKSNTA